MFFLKHTISYKNCLPVSWSQQNNVLSWIFLYLVNYITEQHNKYISQKGFVLAYFEVDTYQFFITNKTK